MNKRQMKVIVKQQLASFLANAIEDLDPEGNVKEHDGPDVLRTIRLHVFSDGYRGSEVEQRRLRNIIYEMHQEAYKYVV